MRTSIWKRDTNCAREADSLQRSERHRCFSSVRAIALVVMLLSLPMAPAQQIAIGEYIAEYPVPTAGGRPQWITAGPDGALWFTERADKIGRITTAGAITEYLVPTANSNPSGITLGPDGALWFTEFLGQQDRAHHHRRCCYRVHPAHSQ